MLQRKAFTLIEMIMVLVIVALMATIVGPQWGNFLSAWDVDTETQKMVAKIRQVQQEAVTHQKTAQIVFNKFSEPQSYTVKRDSILMEGPVYIQGGVTASFVFMNPLETVQFDQFGAPAEGGRVILSKPGQSRISYIDVEPVTGSLHLSWNE